MSPPATAAISFEIARQKQGSRIRSICAGFPDGNAISFHIVMVESDQRTIGRPTWVRCAVSRPDLPLLLSVESIIDDQTGVCPNRYQTSIGRQSGSADIHDSDRPR